MIFQIAIKTKRFNHLIYISSKVFRLFYLRSAFLTNLQKKNV